MHWSYSSLRLRARYAFFMLIKHSRVIQDCVNKFDYKNRAIKSSFCQHFRGQIVHGTITPQPVFILLNADITNITQVNDYIHVHVLFDAFYM